MYIVTPVIFSDFYCNEADGVCRLPPQCKSSNYVTSNAWPECHYSNEYFPTKFCSTRKHATPFSTKSPDAEFKIIPLHK